MADNELLDPSVTDFYFISFFSNSIIRVINGQIDPTSVPNRFRVNNEKYLFNLEDGNYRCMICPNSYSKDCSRDRFCKVNIPTLAGFKHHLIERCRNWNLRLWSLSDDLEIPTGRLIGGVRDLYMRNRNNLKNLRFFDGESFNRINDYKCPFKGCNCNKDYVRLAQLLSHISHLETKEKRILVREVGEDDDQDIDFNVEWQPGQLVNAIYDDIDFNLDVEVDVDVDDKEDKQSGLISDVLNDSDQVNLLKRKIDEMDELDNIRRVKQKIEEEAIRMVKDEGLSTIITHLTDKIQKLLMIINKQNEEARDLNIILEKHQERISNLENILIQMQAEKDNQLRASKFNR